MWKEVGSSTGFLTMPLTFSFSLSSHERFLLRQEQEKHQSALMLYNKTREQLQRKEEQQRSEAEERHKAELKVRSLELEIRALKNSIKQVNSCRLLDFTAPCW